MDDRTTDLIVRFGQLRPRLRAAAASHGLKEGALVRVAVKRYLDNLDEEDAARTARLMRIARGEDLSADSQR